MNNYPLTSDYNSVQKAQDAAFQVDKIQDYVLCVRFNGNDFSVAIFDDTEKKCLYYENCQATTQLSDKMPEAFSVACRMHHFLSAAFWKKVVLVRGGSNFCFVPDAYFDADALPQILQLNGTFDEGNEHIASFKHANLQNVCAFTLPKNIEYTLQGLYPAENIVFAHEWSALVATLAATSNNNELFVVVAKDKLNLAYFKDKKLHFANTFKFLSPKDFVYYVLFALEELGLNPAEATIKLGGEFSPNAPIITSLSDYCKNIKHLDRPKGLSFSHELDQMASYEEFALFSAYYLSQ